jgi:hypothetical protein
LINKPDANKSLAAGANSRYSKGMGRFRPRVSILCVSTKTLPEEAVLKTRGTCCFQSVRAPLGKPHAKKTGEALNLPTFEVGLKAFGDWLAVAPIVMTFNWPVIQDA